MPHIAFTAHLERLVECAARQVDGVTVRAVLDAAFANNDRARSYVLDEQGALRHHMVIFVNGRAVRDRERLSDQVSNDAEVYVMQALSGG
jgi:molybdopterin converting factor small subunit